MINIQQFRKTIFIETYGCAMNEYDTELVKSILVKENYTFVQNELEADIVMLNTCAIREHAHRKIYGRVHEIRNNRKKLLKVNKYDKSKQSDEPLIGILGCMATNLRTELLENKNLDIDFIAGPDSYKRLPQLIEEAMGTGDKQFDLTLSEFETYSDVLPIRKEGVNAWIATSRGCNNFCTFCVVPYTRGRERSRSVSNIIEEVKLLAGEGFKQVTLLGQNVNSYNDGQADFADLLDAVSGVNGIRRIRFTSPHPKDFPDKLLDVVAQNPKVCKQIHLPLQAGNNRILDVMNRNYTQEEFLALVDKVRHKIPDAALSTDIIVGFPTETDAEFEDTFKVMKQAEFDQAFIFKYSERKGTVASKKYPDDVSEEKKTERTMTLNNLQKEVMFKKNCAHIGQRLELLIEDATNPETANYKPGRTDTNKLVILPIGDYRTGDFITAEITDATPHALKGVQTNILSS